MIVMLSLIPFVTRTAPVSRSRQADFGHVRGLNHNSCFVQTLYRYDYIQVHAFLDGCGGGGGGFFVSSLLFSFKKGGLSVGYQPTFGSVFSGGDSMKHQQFRAPGPLLVAKSASRGWSA